MKYNSLTGFNHEYWKIDFKENSTDIYNIIETENNIFENKELSIRHNRKDIINNFIKRICSNPEQIEEPEKVQKIKIGFYLSKCIKYRPELINLLETVENLKECYDLDFWDLQFFKNYKKSASAFKTLYCNI